MFVILSGWSVTWWEFRPRKKIFRSPPKFLTDTLPPLAPAPPLLGDPPCLLGFSKKKNRPTPLPGASDSPLPLPRAEKIKNIRNVHQDKELSKPLQPPKLLKEGTSSPRLRARWEDARGPGSLGGPGSWHSPRRGPGSRRGVPTHGRLGLWSVWAWDYHPNGNGLDGGNSALVIGF